MGCSVFNGSIDTPEVEAKLWNWLGGAFAVYKPSQAYSLSEHIGIAGYFLGEFSTAGVNFVFRVYRWHSVYNYRSTKQITPRIYSGKKG